MGKVVSRQAAATSARIVNPQGLLPRGTDDFAQAMREGCCMVDKSLFIQNVLDTSDRVLLITRPRRFGKTTNLSMLRHFFEHPPTAQNTSTSNPPSQQRTQCLFAKLLIAQDKHVMQHQGQYPVIALTFKNVKETTWDKAYDKLCTLLHNEILRHQEALDFQNLEEFARIHGSVWQRILDRTATQNDWESSLQLLCKLLTLHHKQPPWLLLDEYDTPIHKAYVQSKQDKEDVHDKGSYYARMIGFIQGLFSSCLKGNDAFLHKAVITGILRVAKEDIFSSLNNLGVFGVMDDAFASFFGFTKPEVQELLQQRDLSHRLPAVSQWYDGYRFGEDHPVTIYNPWSVVSYTAYPTQQPKPYWVNTGSTGLIEHLIEVNKEQDDKQAIETLLLGNSIQRDVADDMPLRELRGLEQALWSILLTSGYLTAQPAQAGIVGRWASLRVPNQEVRIAFQRLALRWLCNIPANPLPTMLQALLAGDVHTFSEQLNKLIACTLSFFDLGGTASEKSYHMFLLGLLSHVNGDYKVRSNRESGRGRPDLLLVPLQQSDRCPGIVMEFKIADSEDRLPQAAQAALRQIEQKAYAAEFQDYPPFYVLKLGVAFCGKKAAVRGIYSKSGENDGGKKQ
ncbi:MAG: AAA family ATPase [Myxococcota bacterium]